MKEQKATRRYQKNDGIIFYGPSGCGKTNFVKTMAYEAGIPVLTILAKDLINEKGTVINLDLVFKVVQDYVAQVGPCILFFEELDFLVGNREIQQLDQNAKLVLQNFLDKLGGDARVKGLFIVACTNHKENIDSELFRPGRFGIHIEVDRPTREDIILFCDAFEKKKNIIISQKDELVNQCIGMSVSEVLQKLETFK
jgi:AAA+ superfamily predicted ATPase